MTAREVEEILRRFGLEQIS